jgi:hypothetical protein
LSSPSLLVVTTIVQPLQAAVRQSFCQLVVGGSAHFLLIGLGLIFIEIALLQRLSVLLGQRPIRSALYCSASSLGSLISERRPLRTPMRFSIWEIMTAAYVASLLIWLPDVLVVSVERYGRSNHAERSHILSEFGLALPAPRQLFGELPFPNPLCPPN